MNQPAFTYNPEIAAQSGGTGQYITESCVARGFIESAKFVRGSKGAEGVEYTFESEGGQKANFLTVHYKNNDGSNNEIGTALIHAIMGCSGVKGMTFGKDGDIPELKRRPIMLALERENYYNSKDEEKFKFNIRCAMSARSGLTISEHANSKPADSMKYWQDRFAANQNGAPAKKAAQKKASTGGNQAQAPAGNDLNDDIPW
jgi:hypothetical protein